MTRVLFRRALVACSLLAAIPLVHAEVWGFIDEKGVAHFSSEKMDERYQLFYRGGESFDTSQGAPTARAVPVPTAPPKLLAFFEVSPSFKQVKHHLREASKAHSVDYELLQALIATESGFDPRAVSPKGAIGLMQIMPATAERYGVVADPKTTVHNKLTDPKVNVRTGTRYLRDLIKMYPGQLELALAAYNAGEGAVQRAGNKIPNYRETQNYVKTVMQLYTMLKPPAMAAGPRSPNRVRIELPARPEDVFTQVTTPGGAMGRGNMPSMPSQPSRPSQPSAASQPLGLSGPSQPSAPSGPSGPAQMSALPPGVPVAAALPESKFERE